MTMSTITLQVGDPAGEIAAARSVRRALPLGGAVVDCLFQFPGGQRCALEFGHAGGQHAAIAWQDGRFTVTHVAAVEPLNPSVHATVRLAGRRVALSMPGVGAYGENGTIAPPLPGDTPPLAYGGVRVLVQWDGARGRLWEELDDLVALDARGNPVGRRIVVPIGDDSQRLGLRCSIFTSGQSASAGGVSSRCREVTLVGDAVDQAGGAVVAPTADAPAVRFSTRTGVLSVVPVEQGVGAGPMFGGTFVWCSDTRFGEAAELAAGVEHEGPVPLHDRWER